MVKKTGANHLRSLFTGAYRRLVPSIGANESGLQKVQSSDYRSPEAGISAITKANLRWTYAVVLAFAVRKKRAYSFLYTSSSNRHELVFDNSDKLLRLKGEARMYNQNREILAKHN